MSWSQTLELAARIKPELVAAELTNIESVKDGLYMQNIFKTVKNVDDDRLIIRKTDKDIVSIPFVGRGEPGIAKGSPDYADTAHTVPEMKIHARIDAKDLKKAARYKGQAFMDWMRENYLVEMRRDTDMTLEFLKRKSLADGNMSWPYITKDGWGTYTLTFGTAVAGGSMTNLWNTSSTTIAQVLDGIRGVVKTAKATDGSYDYFQSSAETIVLCPDAMWTLVFAMLNSYQTDNTVPVSVMNENEVKIGDYVFKAFGGYYKNPQTRTWADAITAKQIRIVDKSANAKHVLGFLELDNLEATDSNKHYLVQVVPDKFGEYVDILFRFRPVPAFNPYAMIVATVSS